MQRPETKSGIPPHQPNAAKRQYDQRYADMHPREDEDQHAYHRQNADFSVGEVGKDQQPGNPENGPYRDQYERDRRPPDGTNF